ncbi:hypothetical protein CTAYLR_009656 [Chrysophaeum taylorii]|uniref:Uncharacterized protein n=1 Tax=Chrysophaeum taylorii TaxID=2483200 RepID=A0AAD7ULD9_9STRA|nr:hypothetical protein CTAYLR_009656 [Chrysophaeum taylorii]
MRRRTRERRGVHRRGSSERTFYIVVVVVTCGIISSLFHHATAVANPTSSSEAEPEPVESKKNATKRRGARNSCDLFDLRRQQGRSRGAKLRKVVSGFESIDRHAEELGSLAQRQWLPAHCPINFTLVTQATPERLWMLRWICQRWEGPIVLAVYTDRSTVVEKETSCGDRVDYRIVPATKEVFARHNAYPVNRLRNLAISRVKTSHFLMSDVDLWPDVFLLRRLQALAEAEPDVFRDPWRAIVVPAFARDVKTECSSSTAASDSQSTYRMAECHREAEQMPSNFVELKDCIISKQCHIFDRFNMDGHGTTDYRSWLRQENGVRDIPCFLSNRYEPYVVLAHTPDRPKFEEQFTGYGKNKIQNLVHLRYVGWKFAVLARSFLTHFPHHKSAARIQWENKATPPSQQQGADAATDVDAQHRSHMDKLYRNFLDALIAVYGSPGARDDVVRICNA